MQLEIIRRKVKYARLEFTPQGLKAVVPLSRGFDVEQFLARHKAWIDKKMALYESAPKNSLEQRTLPEFQNLIARMINEEGDKLNVVPRSISFRTMKNRWGSCSNRDELKFNTNLRFLPERLIRYVVYHELCHMRAHKHGAAFKKLLRAEFLDYQKLDLDLLGFWQQIHFSPG